MPIFCKAAFFEAFLGSSVPIQGLQVNSLEVCLVENMIDQGGYGISPIALIPVVTVANHNTQFGFAFSLINVRLCANTNMLTI